MCLCTDEMENNENGACIAAFTLLLLFKVVFKFLSLTFQKM